MKKLMFMLFLLLPCSPHADAAKFVQTPYADPKAVFDFYFNEPEDIDSALYWVRSYMNPMMDAPYSMAPEMMEIVVIIHGMEIVTAAKKNYERYKSAVDRMQYLSQIGVRFRVCGLAANDYGYDVGDFYEFIEVAPSAITELGYWQQQGYALIKPDILSKKYNIEDIR
jgi:intracellular sulfur oxidation DsrE/DsrF family protein